MTSFHQRLYLKGDKTMANQENGVINPNEGGAAGTPQTKDKAGFKGLIDKAHRAYDSFRYSKAGKWVMRGLTVLTVGGTAKFAYDKGIEKGKASVVPTVVTIEKIPETDEAPAEAPAEESAVEEA